MAVCDSYAWLIEHSKESAKRNFQKINLKDCYLGKFSFLTTVKLQLFIYSLYLPGSQGRQTNNHLLKRRNSLCALNANKQKISKL